MAPITSSSNLSTLRTEVNHLLDQLPGMPHGELIQRALSVLVGMAEVEADRLDWKILSASLQDMERAFRVFYPYRHVRKVTIFGSARTLPSSPEYQMAADFARCITAQGFMVMTGAGGGIMEAGNEGAGAANSFGLNIQLPFEQGANPHITGDPKLIEFKYFFTRKLFFLRETDALVLFPGGFGTQDEMFECLTLMQTGKSSLVPLILVDQPGGDYWKSWDLHMRKHLLGTGLISPDDLSLYQITDSNEEACRLVTSFYQVYHSSRYVGDRLVLRLKSAPSDEHLDYLNQEFSDILIKGKIEKGHHVIRESDPNLQSLHYITLHFNQRDLGRLRQMIQAINELEQDAPEATHPEQR